MKGRVSPRLREAINNGSLDAPTPVEPQTLPAEIDPLMQKIEAAIYQAASLGGRAFDLIDGRGLYEERLAIQSEIAALRRLASSQSNKK